MSDTSFVALLQTTANRIGAVWLNQVNKWAFWGRRPNYATTTGAANAQILTLEAGSLYSIGTEADGDEFSFTAGFSNTAAMTIQVIPPGGTNTARAVQLGGTAFVGGEMQAGKTYKITRLGTTWQLSRSDQVKLAGPTAQRTLTLPDANLNLPAITVKGDSWWASAAGVFAKVAAPANSFFFIGDSSQTAGVGTAGIPLSTCEFRLTLTTGVPVTTGDVTAAGTIFCSPFKGNRIALFDGASTWNIRASVEFSLALVATSGKPYDVFCFDNAGVPTLETLVWTNDGARATALALQNGVLVKSGDATRRYLGSFYTSGSNITEDSIARRYLWNYYNRVLRPMKAVDTADTWTYTLAAYRQANGNAANQLDFLRGVEEDEVYAYVTAHETNDNVGTAVGVGIGINSSTVNSASVWEENTTPVTNQVVSPIHATYEGYPGVGRVTLRWLEFSAAVGTTTWRGDFGTTIIQSGIVGKLLA